MKTVFLGSFLTDLKRIRDRRIGEAVARAVADVERADSLKDIRSLKRLSGYGSYYRIRVATGASD
jgi:mRNA interferase RelE/StbE